MRQKGNLKRKIIEKLLPGYLYIPSLINELSKAEKVSIQAVYSALETLKNEETVSIHSKNVSLSLIWLAKEKEKLEFAERSYKAGSQALSLADKARGKIIFTFKTINELDLFWTHAYTILLEKEKLSAPQYSLMPHDFYLYGRAESDSFWIDKNVKSQNNARFIVTHTKPLDVSVMKARRKKFGESFEFLLHENPLKQESNVTYTITGDYILKGVFDKKVNERLEAFVKCNHTLPLPSSSQKEIADILSSKGTFTLTIEKNKKKAELMEKKLRKYFE